MPDFWHQMRQVCQLIHNHWPHFTSLINHLRWTINIFSSPGFEFQRWTKSLVEKRIGQFKKYGGQTKRPKSSQSDEFLHFLTPFPQIFFSLIKSTPSMDWPVQHWKPFARVKSPEIFAKVQQMYHEKWYYRAQNPLWSMLMLS